MFFNSVACLIPIIIFTISSAFPVHIFILFYIRNVTQNSVQYSSCDMVNAESIGSLSLDSQLQSENLEILVLFSSDGNMI